MEIPHPPIGMEMETKKKRKLRTRIKEVTLDRVPYLLKKIGSGFRPILIDTWAHIREAKLLLVASSLAYTTILSIVPLLAVSFSIFQAFGGLDNLFLKIEPFLLENLAQSAGSEALETIKGFVSRIHGGAIGGLGFVFLIATCMSMLNRTEVSINHIWKSPIRRKFFERITSYWFFITVGPLAIAIAFGALASVKMEFGKLLPTGAGGFTIGVLFFYGLYKWFPNRHVYWLSALLGAVFTTLCWTVARSGYGFYIREVVNYSKIYGSLGAIPIFLLWIYLIWIIVLAGAAFSAAVQKRMDSRS